MSVLCMGWLGFWVNQALDLAVALWLCMWLSYIVASIVLPYAFRSPLFEKDMPVAEMIVGIPFFFGVYWFIPYLVMTYNMPSDSLSPLRTLVSASLFNVGLVTIIFTEARTYYMMMYEPQALLSSTTPKQLVRPYLVGEFLLYLSFALLARAFEAYVVLAILFLIVFIPHNLLKQAHILQHVEAYRKYGILSPLFLLVGTKTSDTKDLFDPLQTVVEESMSEMKTDTTGNNEKRQKGLLKRQVTNLRC